MMEAEKDEHLWYKIYLKAWNNSWDSWNETYKENFNKYRVRKNISF